MNNRRLAKRLPTPLLVLPLLATVGLISCKPRAFNDAQTSSNAGGLRKSTEAQAAALMPYWPLPKTAADVAQLPSLGSLGVSTRFWQSILTEAFNDSENGRILTLSSPQCARAVDAWRVTTARLSLYEVDLPGNVTAWQTLALQRETDLAQRVQLHVVLQPWCLSERLGRDDFVHSLDHAFQLTFDLSWPFLSKQNQNFIEELSLRSRVEPVSIVKTDSRVLPYARALLDLNASQAGRSAIVGAWNNALNTQELFQQQKFPDAQWNTLKQTLNTSRVLKNASNTPATHPTLQSQPAALNAFFAKNVSEKNLMRIRAHVTEGVGTAHHFYRWERQSGKLSRVALQTSSLQWDRTANTVTLKPLLLNPALTARVGSEQPINEETRILLRDVDLEATPLANDIALQDLASLNEKVVDQERTSVHTTRCVSCHGLDDAQTFAREGRPVTQRGISPLQLTLSGVNPDGKPIVNVRSVRSAESDAARFEEENQNAQQFRSARQ
ncbi:MAG: hypothetical protein FJY29_03195 [Betaproteobacteria bacterium]|nr:hypothetical protein [Betaproteobacteria bacterium]